MDILYILGKGSSHDNQELRWSLRSIEKYGRNIDRVFVVGEDPGFLSDKVIHVPCEDKYDRKHKNMLYKVQYAVEYTDISDIFLVSSDDIFCLKPFDANDLPMYYGGELPHYVYNKNNKDSYSYQLYATNLFLKSLNLPNYKFAQHCIHKMCRKFFEVNRELIQKSYTYIYGVEPNCWVNNWMVRYLQFPTQSHKDCKLSHCDPEEDATKRISPECTEFSIGDDAWNEYTERSINNMYPDKSKYEK